MPTDPGPGLRGSPAFWWTHAWIGIGLLIAGLARRLFAGEPPARR